MFDELLRTLRTLERGVSIPISQPLDAEGFFDRRCPWDECRFEFKVLFEDWKAKVPDDLAYCPFCGHSDSPQEFNTPAQQEYIREVGIGHLRQKIGEATRIDARSFNAHSRPSGGLIKISMRMEATSLPVTVALPPEALEVMTFRVTCETCGCRFVVVGSAFFCPACGFNSAEHTFNQSLATARASIQAASSVRTAINDRDSAAQVSRVLIESTLTSLVMAFQRYAEVLYARMPSAAHPRRNAFQGLDEGSRLWADAAGRSFEVIVGNSTIDRMRRVFQQRHLLAHREGVVDQDYIERSGDTSYRVGQRLVVRDDAVLTFANDLEQLTIGLKDDVGPATPRTPTE
jgi:uncharacterized Zn finger protein (UPF0148 family)